MASVACGNDPLGAKENEVYGIRSLRKVVSFGGSILPSLGRRLYLFGGDAGSCSMVKGSIIFPCVLFNSSFVLNSFAVTTHCIKLSIHDIRKKGLRKRTDEVDFYRIHLRIFASEIKFQTQTSAISCVMSLLQNQLWSRRTSYINKKFVRNPPKKGNKKIITKIIDLFARLRFYTLILGYTGEIYGNGLQISTSILSCPLAIIISSQLILPILYPLKLISINEYIEVRFKSKQLRFTIFLLTMVRTLAYSALKFIILEKLKY
ncbi:hypothetical protein Avbf_08824 [Armadillidium vulgare]|nr:hypothetical protein Avbf_08824 [Armadillidium vulgare]